VEASVTPPGRRKPGFSIVPPYLGIGYVEDGTKREAYRPPSDGDVAAQFILNMDTDDVVKAFLGSEAQ
jgi:hypothetical protein